MADVIEPGSTWWSGNKALSMMGGLYSLFDTMTNKDQDLFGDKEGFSDFLRYMKGIGIQRDWNPLGLLYDADEADYYKGYYKKMKSDKKKLNQREKWQKRKMKNLKGDRMDKSFSGRSRDI